MQSPEALTELFRAHGRKITTQRQCIFRALAGDASHPTAERVYERVRYEIPNVSLKTVYQTLNDLADLGAIAVLDVGTGATRFDPNVETTHHHLVCRSCGKVRDLTTDLPALTVSRRAAQGFTVDSAEVVFRGQCEECRTAQSGGVAADVSQQTQHGNLEKTSRRAEKGTNQPCQH
jgi:Fe2+ or Zn2+ uptake regulation protein